MINLCSLEERLTREAPALNWSCEPITRNRVAGSALPQEIQVLASRGGVPVKGSPFYISGECLLRWGLDRCASLICNELTPRSQDSRHAFGMDWDRLAEI